MLIKHSNWITRPKPNSRACFRLVCFPYAGGGASIFQRWPDNMPGRVEVLAVQLPGRENRLGERPLTRLAPAVEELTGILLPYLEVPFAFFGHSLGALVSFEVARQLRRENGPVPAHLFVSAHGAPQVPRRGRSMHHLPQSELIEELRQLDGTSESVLRNEELMRIMLPTLRADFEIRETYAYKAEAPLGCPVSALGGLEDSRVSCEDLAVWREQTTSSFTMRMFPGNHFYLHKARPMLLRSVCRDLASHLGDVMINANTHPSAFFSQESRERIIA